MFLHTSPNCTVHEDTLGITMYLCATSDIPNTCQTLPNFNERWGVMGDLLGYTSMVGSNIIVINRNTQIIFLVQLNVCFEPNIEGGGTILGHTTDKGGVIRHNLVQDAYKL